MSLPYVEHPTDRPNFYSVGFAGFRFYYSYKTCIAFYVSGVGEFVCENDWGPTTGKHINYVSSDKTNRLPREEFNRLLSTYTEAIGRGVEYAVDVIAGKIPTAEQIEQAAEALREVLKELHHDQQSE